MLRDAWKIAFLSSLVSLSFVFFLLHSDLNHLCRLISKSLKFSERLLVILDGITLVNRKPPPATVLLYSLMLYVATLTYRKSSPAKEHD